MKDGGAEKRARDDLMKGGREAKNGRMTFECFKIVLISVERSL